MNPLKLLQEYGQAVWLDFIARRLIAEGGLGRLIEDDGVRGVTSNPAIFEKATGETADYDASLAEAERQGDRDVVSLYEGLAIEDIRAAADLLRPTYEATARHDGYVSLEVSPYLALNTKDTVVEARRLWQAVDRPNLMVKVPATPAGLPAIRQLIGEGININITLLFSQTVYEEVVEAYLQGIEALVARGGDPRGVASVASFFVSRIDTAVDGIIEKRLRETNDGGERDSLASLRGKVAIANAKLAYQRYRRLFSGPRWEALRAKGAQTQRLLWASTGTKNPAYRDVMYIEELIGADTVNTMPPATMDAFRDHGKTRASLEENIDGARRVMATLDRIGISIDEVTKRLVEEGVQLFSDAADKLLAAVARKRAMILGDAVDPQKATLPSALQGEIEAMLPAWQHAGNIRRLWARDTGLWTGTDEDKWLGWLDIVEQQQRQLGRLRSLAEEIKEGGFSHLLLLGMGGSSLGPEVFAETFGRQAGAPELLVLDSTDPAEIRSFEKRVDLARTLFIVSSKSGSTLEPNILKQYFLERVRQAVGAKAAGSRFIAITDPGSQLQKAAERDGFRHIFPGVPSIGGRYSVLSNFGLVPAAAMGLDVARLLDTAGLMMRSCGASVPPGENPGALLGIALGTAARAGRDKLTILTSPGIADFGAWLEQLVAESTGKEGKGIIPVEGEPLGSPEVYGRDRLFVVMRLAGEADAKAEASLAALERAGHPLVRITLRDRYQIAQEFFRWEIATAVAGAVIGINPFDQPDVEASKVKTRELTTAYEESGRLPPETPILREDGIALFADPRNAEALRSAAGGASLVDYVRAHFGRLASGDYSALLAYIERNERHRAILGDIRRAIRDRKRVATCVGFGPRFLHSTGQAYKGGPNSGVFLQITCDDAADLAVPGQKYTFGVVKAAQARGDFDVLAERGRRALRVHLAANVGEGLAVLKDVVERSLA